jgi:hypothetical protein
MALLPRNGSIACLYVYELFSGLASPCLYAAPQIFAGPSATARWVGIQNLCGILSGILAPALTGALVDASGSYVSAFVVAGGGLWIDRCTRVEGSSSGAQKWLMVLGYLSGLIAAS